MKNRISIYTNMTKPRAGDVLERAAEAAEHAGFAVKSFTGALDLFADAADFPPDLIVTIGGDGTMLKTLSTGVNNGFINSNAPAVPILGINLGHVGFFTETDIDGFPETLSHIIAGEYRVDEASMLRCTGDDGFEYVCLNEFYVAKHTFTPAAQLELTIDGLPTGVFHGDGVIVCSSTGSTGYSISAGGPIAAPGLDAMFVTPVCPHSLTVRPIAAPITAVVKVTARSECLVYSDGVKLVSLPKNSSITVRRAAQKARFVRVGNRSIFKLIREKLA